MTGSSVDLVAIGGIRCDHVIAADGTWAGPLLGGNAVYAAAGARLWGASPGIVSRINAQIPVSALRPVFDAGINLDGVSAVAGNMGLRTFIRYFADGTRIGLTREEFCERTSATFSHQDDDDLRPRDRRYEDLHVAVSPVPSQMPPSFRAATYHLIMTMPWTNQQSFVSSLAANGTQLLLDVYESYMAEVTDHQLRETLTRVKAILPSEAELRCRYPSGSLIDGARSLLSLGCPGVVLKLGSRGSVVLRPDDEPVFIPAYPTTEKDPTGAGDSFLGGLAAGLLESEDLVKAALHGTVAASFTVEDFGLARLLGAKRVEAQQRLEELQSTMTRPPMA